MTKIDIGLVDFNYWRTLYFSECPPDHGCSDICVPMLMTFECACHVGRILTSDQKTCKNGEITKWKTKKDLCVYFIDNAVAVLHRQIPDVPPA